MEIKIFPNGIFEATTYLIYDEISSEAILIDCTCCVDEIEKFIKDKNLNLKHILITHGHFDHVYCVSKMKEKFPQTQVVLHKDDLTLLNQVPLQCDMMDIEKIEAPKIDVLLNENPPIIKLGHKEIKILHTKGHSKGGVCYLIDDILFSGDTLFRNSIGRCDLFGGSFEEIEKSIKEKLFTLNDETIVHPGHGEYTTIGYEKKYNSYFGQCC